MSNLSTSTSLRAMLTLCLAMLLWASSFIALKFAFASYDAMFVIWARMLIAGCCFLFFIKQLMRFSYKKGDWKLLSVMAFLEPCLYFIFEAKALANTSASQAGAITALLPLLIAIIAYFMLGERITKRQLAGFLLAFSGVLVLSFGGDSSVHAPNPLWGNFLEFLAMCCAAAYSVLLKRFSVRYSAVFLTAFPAIVGLVFFFPLMLANPWPTHIDVVGLGAIAYLGVVVTLGAYLCYNYAIAIVPVTIAGAFGNLIPVFTVLLAWFILGERLTNIQLLACGIVGLGVIVSQYKVSGGVKSESTEL